MTIETFEMEQGTDAWLLSRLGIPTASSFKDILAKGQGKTRRTYMLKLAGEIITGEPTESYTNGHMDRGHEMESAACEEYSFITAETPQLVGFVRNGRKGASPDALIGENGGAEFKSKLPHLLAEVLLKDQVPSEHVAQVQGSLWVCEREWWDFVAYWPKMPLFIKRMYRDEAYIKTLATEVDRFNDELDETVKKLRRYGQSEAA